MIINQLLNCKFHLRFIIPPLVRYFAENITQELLVNEIKRGTPLIISMTSYEDRFDDLELSLYSLFNQTIRPDRIVLWLSDEYKDISNLPYFITRYIKNGLEIKFVQDIRSYTKIIYALKEFSKSIIVTADDDVYYKKDWLEKLYHSYIANPQDIHVHRAHRVKYANGEILSYENWEKHVKEETARYDNFLTGVGGVLYPPDCFSKEVFREDIFLKNSPFADDIWLWIMALLSNRKVRIVKNHIETITCTDFFGQLGLKNKRTLYGINKLGENDIQLKRLMKYYGRNIKIKLESEDK